MNLSHLIRFDLVTIRLALACAQSGSLSQAAREVHLAVAAASRRLREFEEALGSPLFERHARGLTLTPAGRVFVRHGLALMQSMSQLGDEISDLQQGVARHIRLCANTAALNQFLPPLLAAYAEQVPQVRLDLEEQVSEGVVAALREGRCDVGIFVEGPDIGDLRCQAFRQDELVFVLPRKHPLARARKPLPIAEALDQDWIGLNAGAASMQQLQQSALTAGKPLKLRMQVRSFDAVCHLVASGLGIALLPKAATAPLLQGMQLVSRPLAEPWARRRLMVATGIGVRADDPAIQGLLAFLREPSQNTKAKV